jgi:phage host-nuclease inhibitor protein Gam
MATRKSKVIQSGITKEQMETAFGEYAVADARLGKINATITVETTRIRDKYSYEIAKLTENKDANFEIMQAYALENPDTFGKKKSIEGTHGVFGFRTGTPKLKPLKGFTWGAVTNLLKEFLPGYIRTSEEPAKDRLLADRESEGMAENLKKAGLTVVQDETFFVELKKEGSDE